MAFFTARCIRDSSTCQRPSWPVNSFFQRFFYGKSHCHLSSCCLKDILSQGHWEGLRLRILRPNLSGEFFWLPQSVFSGFTWPTICVWFRTLFLESFSELRFRLCFLILNGSSIFFKKRRLPEKDSLSWFFWGFLLISWGLICVIRYFFLLF